MLGPQLASGSDPSELAARRSLVWLPLWLPRPSALAWLIPCLQSAVSTCGAVPDRLLMHRGVSARHRDVPEVMAR